MPYIVWICLRGSTELWWAASAVGLQASGACMAEAGRGGGGRGRGWYYKQKYGRGSAGVLSLSIF